MRQPTACNAKTPIFSKGDTHSFVDRFGVTAMLKIESKPIYKRGVAELSYKVSIDGKNYRGGMPEGWIHRLISEHAPKEGIVA
jgi:hypothetical protein